MQDNCTSFGNSTTPMVKCDILEPVHVERGKEYHSYSLDENDIMLFKRFELCYLLISPSQTRISNSLKALVSLLTLCISSLTIIPSETNDKTLHIISSIGTRCVHRIIVRPQPAIPGHGHKEDVLATGLQIIFTVEKKV